MLSVDLQDPASCEASAARHVTHLVYCATSDRIDTACHSSSRTGAPEQPMLLSGLKAGKYGFHACMDSEQMFLDWIGILQEARIIPA
jgi:hypothetical protein